MSAACPKCGVYAHRSKTPRCARLVGRPSCPVHRRPMEIDRHARGGLRCAPCVRERRARRAADREQREAEAARLLASVSASLPRYLTPDEREDAAQSIILDVMTGELSPDGLTPPVLRSYASRARGMVRDGFCFISLSAPAGDRRTFEDLLEG